MFRGPSAIKWEYNGVCVRRCSRICEGAGIVRIHDDLLTKLAFLIAQRDQILLNLVSIAL